MQQIIWTHGEKFNKTKKDNKPILNSKNEIVNNIPLRGETTRNRDKLQQDKLELFVQERPMLVQTYQNPFLTKDFTDVINDQEKFLIPKDSFVENQS
tara:strand:+ start:39 stop:329 length:291 start_codon:yes stop_codon:yes gene_type:complete